MRSRCEMPEDGRMGERRRVENRADGVAEERAEDRKGDDNRAEERLQNEGSEPCSGFAFRRDQSRVCQIK